MNTRLRARNWLKRVATSNFVAYVPRVIKAALLASSDAFAWRDVAAASGARGAFGAAYWVLGRETAHRLLNPLFDADWYMSRYGLGGRRTDAFVHYLLIGDRLGLQPHPWFDSRFVRGFHRIGWWRCALAWYARQPAGSATAHPVFDSEWYLQGNLDVASSSADPLVHYVLYGQGEGRAPNAYFDAAWYGSHNPDVLASGLPPALHFVLYGARENRDPGPGFNARLYARSHGDRRLPAGHELDPLGHYLTIGRRAGLVLPSPAIPLGELLDRPAEDGWAAAGEAATVDVVLPVYRGLEETRACIESVMRSTGRTPIRLRIYNDASPEPEVTRYLREFAAGRPDVALVENEANLGFVRTVNSGMRAAMAEPDFDCVILLNSDTVVAPGWVDRLVAHARAPGDGVATVTALSNNATICSYPHLGPNAMPEGFDTAAVDAAAADANRGRSVEVPTGVGFCMVITRRALETIGLFDEEAFGRGYGEENDFCLRASRAGLSNRLALDIFVQHVGEVSFAEVSKPGKLVAESVIRSRYPDYERLVAEYCATDPGRLARIRLTFALWRQSGKPVQVLFTHDVGGGTERHVRERSAGLRKQGHVVVIRPAQRGGNAIRILNEHPVDSFDVEIADVDADGLARLLRSMGATRTEIHHVLGFGPYLRAGIARSGVSYDFVVHDYYTICPQVTLSPIPGTYCGEPDERGCNACIARRPSHDSSDIWNWRVDNAWLVEGASEVRAPSHDTATRMQRYFGRAISVAPHEPVVARLARARAPVPSGRQARVLVLGTLAPHKGQALVLAAAARAQEQGARLHFHLIGQPQGEVPASALGRLSWTGPYEEADLRRLIEQAQGDAVLFASPIPETYSYTLSAAMDARLPIVATAIGAFPERLEGYDALLVPANSDADALVLALEEFLGVARQVREAP